MLNEHVVHLASLAGIGTPVMVVKSLPKSLTQSAPQSQASEQSPL